jgi:hypothetical protein
MMPQGCLEICRFLYSVWRQITQIMLVLLVSSETLASDIIIYHIILYIKALHRVDFDCENES